MSAIINEPVFNVTISKVFFITSTGNVTFIVKSNLHTSRSQINVLHYTIVYSECFLNNRSKIVSTWLGNIITNSTPTETFNVDNNGKFSRIRSRISNFVLRKSTRRMFRKSSNISSTHNTGILVCSCCVCVVMSTNSTRT